MDKLFCAATDKLEWFLSQWWGFTIYVLVSLCFFYWGWDGVDRFIYMSNAIIVVLLLNANRRDSLATHKKLDDLVPPEHEGLEKKLDREIEAEKPFEDN